MNYQLAPLIDKYWEEMGWKIKETKGAYNPVDEPIEGTRFSVKENGSVKVVHSPRLLQAAKSSGTSKVIFLVSDDSNIEVVGTPKVLLMTERGMSWESRCGPTSVQ